MHKLFLTSYQQMPSFPNGHVDDDGYGRRKIKPGRMFGHFMLYPAAGIIVVLMAGAKVTYIMLGA
jgi:hypothetical protein